MVGHLQEVKQSTFANRIDDLVVGIGSAGKARTHVITTETQNVITVEGFIGLLEEERSIRQIHLSLHTLDSSKESYDTEASSEEDHKPVAKLRKPAASRGHGGRHANKRVKQEDTKVKAEKMMKVCRTIE